MNPELKSEILRLTRQYTEQRHGPRQWSPGEQDLYYSGRVFDADEVEAGVNSMLDFWLTLGAEGKTFEKSLSEYLGVNQCVLTNSGSSANLLAMAALTSDKLGERRIKTGDEVITTACGFPTTAFPIVQCGAVPVFIDSDTLTLNARVEELEKALSHRTKAVIMAHTLGNPFDLDAVTAFCNRHGLWLICDNCDSLGSLYDGKDSGSFGDLSTQSFFPAHHITMGEGGSVNVVREPRLAALVKSFRDWGRGCWCSAGEDNSCGKRFGWKIGDLPYGYDHKNTYQHIGYNLKPLDPQAAIGSQQLKKLPAFNAARRANWEYLRRGLDDLSGFFQFMLPTHAVSWVPDGFTWDSTGNKSDPAWFGFLLTVRDDAPFNLNNLTAELSRARIGHRMLFGGNLTRQPAFTNLLRDNPIAFRAVGNLAGADHIMNHCVFLGTYPGLTRPMLDYMIETLHSFVKKF